MLYASGIVEEYRSFFDKIIPPCTVYVFVYIICINWGVSLRQQQQHRDNNKNNNNTVIKHGDDVSVEVRAWCVYGFYIKVHDILLSFRGFFATPHMQPVTATKSNSRRLGAAIYIIILYRMTKICHQGIL